MRQTCILWVALALGACVAQAGDWTQWRGSNRDLIVTETGLAKAWPEGGPKQLWQTELPGDGYSEPIVVGGKVFVTGNTGGKDNRVGNLYVLDPKTGELKGQVQYAPEWAASYECARTTPTYHDGKLYLIGGLGHVVCVSAADGKIIWSVDAHKEYGGRNITWGIADNPLIYDGKVICSPGGPDTGVVALDVNTGKLVWKSVGLGEKSAYCSPALLTLNGKLQLVTQLEDHAVGLEPDTGKLIWKHPHRNQHAVHPNPPVLCGENKVFISSGYKLGSEMLEISGNEAKRVWAHKPSDNHFQGIAIYQGRVFSSGGGKLWCFDPADGREVYTIEGAKKPSFCITPAGMITYDENGGKVMLVDVQPDSSKVISTFEVKYGNGPHWSSPVVANGVLYLRHGNGIAAFDISEK